VAGVADAGQRHHAKPPAGRECEGGDMVGGHRPVWRPAVPPSPARG
jgi:hypothetical protein